LLTQPSIIPKPYTYSRMLPISAITRRPLHLVA
jgi:hypothetical protein